MDPGSKTEVVPKFTEAGLPLSSIVILEENVPTVYIKHAALEILIKKADDNQEIGKISVHWDPSKATAKQLKEFLENGLLKTTGFELCGQNKFPLPGNLLHHLPLSTLLLPAEGSSYLAYILTTIELEIKPNITFSSFFFFLSFFKKEF